jgi:hypothetical protein
MGRIKIDDRKKKRKISVSIDPEIIVLLKEKSINISSLINKLLKKYIENGSKNL